MRKKFKLRYRILILTAIFIGALYFFSNNYLVVQSFDLSIDTTEMAESSLPSISLISGGNEINRLYGYTSNLDWNLNRETITPLDSEKTFTVRIDENRMTVRKLKYELFDVTGGEQLESGEISALTTEDEGECKIARIKLKSELKNGSEYSLKITLITSASKRVYYYTRVKMYTSGGALTEKLDYVYWFRDSALNKTNQLSLEKNLETKSNSDSTSFAHVDIESSWEMVSWGDLYPHIIAELPPTITEFYEETCSVVLSYVVSVSNETGVECYLVRECFRFLYTDIRTYLYNYERETEAIYDPALTSLAKDDLKLGVTSDTDMEIFTTTGCKYTAYVRNRELWCYERENNSLVRVFSFRSEEDEPQPADLYDDHAVKILNLEADGTIDFLVYGYMNRGDYEGRVGIVLYRYYREDRRIEEQAYFPLNTTYQLLRGEIDEFIYLNSNDVLYFTLFDTIYSYNLITRSLVTVAEEVIPEHISFYPELHTVVWQGRKNDAESEALTVLNLETSARSSIAAPEGERIAILEKMDNHLVYGFAKEEDIAVNYDGTQTVPLYRVLITSLEGEVYKEYRQEGIYVTDSRIEDNVLVLERVKKRDSESLSYEAAASDAIQNRTTTTTPSVSITSRTTELMKKEYYITFPGDVAIDEIPGVSEVSLTVLTTDPTVRVTASDTYSRQYRTYSFGKVILRTTDAATAIRLANGDENVGAVIDSDGRLVWERGVKAARSSISGIVPLKDGKLSSLQTVLKMIFAYEGFEVDMTGVTFEEKSVTDRLEQYLNVSAVNLKGAGLDEVLYYVYKKRPVIAITGEDSALLIYGYDALNIEVIDTDTGLTRKINREQAEEWFAESGNLFFSYVKKN